MANRIFTSTEISEAAAAFGVKTAEEKRREFEAEFAARISSADIKLVGCSKCTPPTTGD